MGDRADATDLVAKLGRWLDDPTRWNLAEARALYTEDAVVQSPRGGASGLVDIVDYLRRTSDEGDRTQHSASDVLVELDGDRAAVSANLLVWFYRPGAAPHATVGLRYAFDAVRTVDGWRFARAEVNPLWRQVTVADPA